MLEDYKTPIDPTKIRDKYICLDVDGTLTSSVCFTEKDIKESVPLEGMVEFVKELYKGNMITIYTARRDSLIPATMEWLRRYNIPYHAISNLKITADLYIDDKAVNAHYVLK